MEHTRRLAEFSAALSLDELPPEVVRKAKLCMLDYVANVYGSLELGAVQSVVTYFRERKGPDEVSVLGCGFKTAVRDAAFLNGTLAEAIEAQDGLRFGGNHACSAVMPAALAVGEMYGRNGREVLEAVITGYEVANRVAATVHPYHTLSGFLPTGTCGTFGAAVAAARLKGLDVGGIHNALGVAGYLVPLSMAEQLMGGYTVKIVQGGQAAQSAITAVGLAEAGLTGDPVVLEGGELRGGFTQITVKAEPVLERLTDGLGDHYTIMDVYFKPYTACRHTHGAAQATLELLAENDVEADDVESVLVRTYAVAAVAVGKGIPEDGSFVSAQFSTPYVVAACLLDGEMGPAQLTDERMADPRIAELLGRVTVEQDDELNAVYPDKTASRVELTLKDGRKLSRQVDIPRGDPRDPMEEDAISDKLRRFASLRTGRDAEGIIDFCLRLDEVKNINELAEMI